jgi:hypothetical protein
MTIISINPAESARPLLAKIILIVLAVHFAAICWVAIAGPKPVIQVKHKPLIINTIKLNPNESVQTQLIASTPPAAEVPITKPLPQPPPQLLKNNKPKQ